MLGSSQVAEPLNITRAVYTALISTEASARVVRQCWMIGSLFCVSLHVSMNLGTKTFGITLVFISKPVSSPTLYFFVGKG